MRSRTCCAWAISGTLLLLPVGPALGQINASWTNAAGGYWTMGTNWSTDPDFPHNSGSSHYDATIDLAGDPYTVSLDSDVAIDNLTLNSSAATLLHTAGVFEVLGTADLVSGLYRLDGGTIRGGTWSIGSGTFEISNSKSNWFDGVTVNGLLELQTGARLQVRNGLNINGGLVLHSGATIGFDGVQTLDNTTIAATGGSGSRDVTIYGGSALTLGPNLAVHADTLAFRGSGDLTNQGQIHIDTAGRNLVFDVWTFRNEGTIAATSGSSLYLGQSANQQWTNATGAVIRATDSIMWLNSKWTNDGMIEAINSTVNLGGAFKTASLGGFLRTGGTVNLRGQVDNAGDVLTLDATTGSWNLLGATIRGGVVNLLDGEGFKFDSNSTIAESLLDDVTVNGDLLLPKQTWSPKLRLGAGAVIDGDITIRGNSTLSLDTGRTMDNSTIHFDTTMMTDNATVRVLNPGTLTLGPEMVVRGGQGTISGQTGTLLVNQGTIVAETANLTLTVTGGLANEGTVSVSNGAKLVLGDTYAQHQNAADGVISATDSTATLGGHWENHGTISAANSTLAINATTPYAGRTFHNDGLIHAVDSSVTLGASWSNSGTISIDNSKLTLGGEFTTAGLGTLDRVGGTVEFTGVLDNTGDALSFDAMTGSWNMAGGTIRGGTISQSANDRLTFSPTTRSTLDDVYFNGSLYVDGRARATPGLDLSGTVYLLEHGDLVFDTGQVLDNMTLRFDGGADGARIGTWGNSGNLVFGPNMQIIGEAGAIYGGGSGDVAVINQGMIRVDGNLRRLEVAPTIFVNEGTITNGSGGGGNIQVGGNSHTWRNAPDGQILMQNGILTLLGDWTNEGLIRVQGGDVELGGNFTTSDLDTFDPQGCFVSIEGQMDNRGAAYNLSSSASTWRLGGPVGAAWIVGGTITSDPGVTLHGYAGLLDGVVLDHTDVFIDDRWSVSVGGAGLTLADSTITIASDTFTNDTGLFFRTSQTLNGTGEILFAGGPLSDQVRGEKNTVLTIGPDILIHGKGGMVGRYQNDGVYSVINEGRIACDTSGGYIAVGGTGFVTNNGTFEARNTGSLYVMTPDTLTNFDVATHTLTGGHWAVYANSTLDLGSISIMKINADVLLSGPLSKFEALNELEENAGLFTITQYRNFITATDFSNSGHLKLGAYGTLTVHGDFVQAEAALLEIVLRESGIEGVFGSLSIADTAFLDGLLGVAFDEHYTPTLGDSFVFLTAASIDGGFCGLDSPALPSGWFFDLDYAPASATLTIMPEPSTMLLLVTAVSYLVPRRRSRI